MWILLVAAAALILVGASNSGGSILAKVHNQYLATSNDPNTFDVVPNPPFEGAKTVQFFAAMAVTQWHTGVWMTPDGKLFRFGQPNNTQNAKDGFVLVAKPVTALRIGR